MLATLYRIATLHGMSGYTVSASRLLVAACFAMPVILLAERLLHGKGRTRSSVDDFAFSIGVGFPILACIAAGVVILRRGWDSVDRAEWGIVAGIAMAGVLVAVLNVEMVSAAAKQNVNPSFPMAVASACYLILTFVVNVVLFGEMEQGWDTYVEEHGKRVIALGLVVSAVVMMYV